MVSFSVWATKILGLNMHSLSFRQRLRNPVPTCHTRSARVAPPRHIQHIPHHQNPDSTLLRCAYLERA